MTLAGFGQEQDPVERIGRLGARLILQQALEDEVTEFLGRTRDERADVEAALEETFEEPVIGKSTVSRVLQDTRERYRRWCERRLEEHDLVYLFCHALFSRCVPTTSRPRASWSSGALPWRAARCCSGSP
jgi:hypothetical protein